MIVLFLTTLLSATTYQTTNGLVMKSSSSSPDPPMTYPLARRSLIERARSIDPALAEGKTSGSYSSIGWSNRIGTVLTPASIPGVYTGDRPFYWNNIDVGCRMTVIELQSSNDNNKPDLFVHSPVGLDKSLIDALDTLGTVKHVVSPNYEHVSFAKQWGEYYQDAYMWGCPGMMEKKPEIRWTGELPYGCCPPDFQGFDEIEIPEGCFDFGEVQPMHFDIEVNPFTGRPFFNEVVFYHKTSKTLMMTDTFWNYPSGDGVTNRRVLESMGKEGEEDFGVWELAPEVGTIPIGSRLWKVGMDQIYRPFYLNLMVKKESRDKFQNIVHHIIDIWDVETLIPAHGDIIRGKTLIRTILKRHFDR